MFHVRMSEVARACHAHTASRNRGRARERMARGCVRGALARSRARNARCGGEGPKRSGRSWCGEASAARRFGMHSQRHARAHVVALMRIERHGLRKRVKSKGLRSPSPRPTTIGRHPESKQATPKRRRPARRRPNRGRSRCSCKSGRRRSARPRSAASSRVPSVCSWSSPTCLLLGCRSMTVASGLPETRSDIYLASRVSDRI